MSKKYLSVLVLVLILGLAFAGFETGETEISENYAVGGYISGWIDIEFENHSSAAEFTDSFGNSVKLIDVLKESSYTYECENNCSILYSASNYDDQKQFTLDKDEAKILGIKYLGRNVLPEDIEFNITSTAPQSDKNQLEIDFFNDGEMDSGNTNSGVTQTGIDHSCFDEGDEDVGEISLDSIPYCQKFKLKTAPGFEIGAWIKEALPGDSEISLELVDEYGDSIDSCELNKTEQSLENGREIFCSIDYLVQENDDNDYYVCLKTDGMGGTYMTQGYPTIDGCGFEGSVSSSKDELNAYGIAVKRKYFGEMENVRIKNSNPSREEDLTTLISNYLWEEYDGAYCLPDGCYVPIKFTSKIASQDITINDIHFSFSYDGGSHQKDIFYDLKELPPKIDSSMARLSINNLFPIEKEPGDHTYSLYFNGTKILEKNILIEDLDIYLSPTIAPSGFPITYKISTPTLNATGYEWDFGEGVKTTLDNTKTHTYTSVKNYTVTVSVSSSLGQKFTESFKVIVESPQTMIDTKVNRFNSKLTFLKSKIDNYDPFEKSQIEKKLNISEIENKIAQIELIKNQSEKQNETINLILSLEIPNIVKSSGIKLPYFPNTNLIDTEIVQEVTNNSGNTDNTMEDAIASWNQQNLEIKISKNKISKVLDENSEYLVSVFELESTEKDTIEEDYYLIIGDMRGLEIADDSSFIDEGGYKYMKVEGNLNILFAIEEDLEMTDLPIYFTPKIENLPQLTVDVKPFEDQRMTILILIFVGLILVGITVYIVLQRWYKVKYEKYLFKDRNYLFNMITYVNNSKKQGLDNDTIKKNLKKVGWDQEQIRYVMRKYSGKNTGMPKLSPRKLLKKKNEDGRNNPQGKYSYNQKPKISPSFYKPKPVTRMNPNSKLNNSTNNPSNNSQKTNNKYQDTINSFRNSIKGPQGNNKNKFNR